jgi:putative membrane protein insertion efficiency factor
MEKQPISTVIIEGSEYSLHLDDTLRASVLRTLTGTTPLDTEVDNLALPDKPSWLRISIRLLRWYRATLSPGLGHRCVYEPSCSRYAELALRKYGFSKGLHLSAKRLYRCRRGAGGLDNP